MSSKQSFARDENKEKRTARCTKCDTWKPFSEFTIIRREPHRRNTQSSCKKCCNEWCRDKAEKAKEEYRKREQGLGIKQCSMCLKERPLDCFSLYSGNHHKSAYLPRCDDCRKIATETKEKKKKKNARDRWKPNYQTIEGRVSSMFHGARNRARQQCLKFNLTRDWIRERLIAGYCEVSGLEFDMKPYGIGKRNLRAPSIDRIQAQGNYTMDNCQMTILGYNLAKCDGTDEQVIEMAIAIVDRITLP